MKSVENYFKKPTLDEFCDFIESKGFDIDAFALYKEFDSNGWRNVKGEVTRSWTALVCARNGVICQRKKKAEMERLGVRRKSRNESRQKTNLRIAKAKTKDVRMHYGDYLHDKRWYSFRKFIFAIRGCECERCHSHENLQVHHIKYKEGLYPWEYSCKDVMVLCKKCHARIHGLPV